MLVPTIDTCRYSYIIEYLLKFKKNIFITGSGGTGKSVLLSSLLDKIKEPNQIDNFALIFSA
jgi:DNA replication protein DnaC